MAGWQFEERALETKRVREQIKKLGLDEHNFCLVPFTTIILEPDGQVGMCRQKGSDFPIGNIKENTIEEIWNGEKARKWRREFLTGSPINCATEVRHRRCNHCPENNKLLSDIELNEIQTTPIRKLTANFNGKCNLQCQMCDIWQKPNGLYDEINFWEPAKKNIFPFLKEIDMLSGEPFIQPDTYRLIDEVTKVNTSCQWTITTNAHWKLSDKIKADLDRIYIKNIIFSVDSLDKDTYYKIRYPGKLDFVLENIDKFIEYNNSRPIRGQNTISLVLNFLVQKDNWKEVSNVIDYCEKKGIIPFITFLYVPNEFSVLDFATEKRLEILNYYLDNLNKYRIMASMRVLIPLLESLPVIDKANLMLKMKKTIT